MNRFLNRRRAVAGVCLSLLAVASLAACSSEGGEASESIAPTVSAAPTPSEVRFYAPPESGGGSGIKEPTVPVGKPNIKVPSDILPTLPPEPSVAPTELMPVPDLPTANPIPSDLPTDLLPPTSAPNPVNPNKNN